DYLSRIVSYVGWRLRDEGDLLLELDYAKRYHMVLNVLGDLEVDITPKTWFSILDSLLDGVSVPFNGEPLEGLQIMGPLETRALDFKNLVILSANEGVFPRRSVSSSFIPPELRRGFGLPTYEYQDAVWAYYFYRLIQRAEKVWMVYDSRTEGLKSGEESRYIKQLQYHFGLPLIRESDAASLHETPVEAPIPKTAEDIGQIRKGPLSASALQSYLSCPAKFYYQWVKQLEAEEEVAESLDAGMIGNVFHKTMQQLYSRKEVITADDIREMLSDKAALKEMIRRNIMKEMNSFEVRGRNLVIEGILADYVTRTLGHDLKLLEDSHSAGFRIFCLEKEKFCDFEGFRFHGFVDRIDSYLPGKVRVLDYKTGKVVDEDININDDNAEKVVEKLFGETDAGRPKIALQLYIYGLLAEADPKLKGMKVVNSIYSTLSLFSQPLEDHEQSPVFVSLMRERLKGLLEEMVDPSVPFTRTDQTASCQYCDFKMICGR
ncbi:MAG: PD-(D/E)XK nuclease family protein, partial [Bacteroidales bacterium]|nr:PD-(D/E)XK nuclease family protein [Bacteroidales bacterium]